MVFDAPTAEGEPSCVWLQCVVAGRLQVRDRFGADPPVRDQLEPCG